MSGGLSVNIQTYLDCCLLTVYRIWIVELELSSPFYSILLLYSLSVVSFSTELGNFFQAWVLIRQWIQTAAKQDRGDSGPTFYRLRYAASFTYYQYSIDNSTQICLRLNFQHESTWTLCLMTWTCQKNNKCFGKMTMLLQSFFRKKRARHITMFSLFIHEN